MSTPQKLVTQRGGVTVIGGGAVGPGDLETALAVAPLLVAADGGADRALEAGQTPALVIGDLDSLGPAARAAIPAARIHHVAEQDSTDFTKCLRRIRADFIVAVGFCGHRLDHALAALTALVTEAQCPVILLAPDDVVFLAPPRLSLDLPVGMRFSLWPMGPARGDSTGLEWPITGIEMAPGGRVGTSNRVSGPVTLTIEGPMLVLLPRPAFGAVLRGLGCS